MEQQLTDEGGRRTFTLEQLQREFSHVIWGLMYVCGTLLVQCFGEDSNEIFWLRESAPGARLPVASAYAAVRPQQPEPLHGETSEDTDSGLIFSSHESSQDVDVHGM